MLSSRLLAVSAVLVACDREAPAPQPTATITVSAPSSAEPPPVAFKPVRGPFSSVSFSCVRFPTPSGYMGKGKMVEASGAVRVEAKLIDPEAFHAELGRDYTPTLAIGDEMAADAEARDDLAIWLFYPPERLTVGALLRYGYPHDIEDPFGQRRAVQLGVRYPGCRFDE